VPDPDPDPVSASSSAEDVALVLAASEDASSLAILRKRGEDVQPAILRKAEEGKPLLGELVRLSPREAPEDADEDAGPALFDVETLYRPPTPEPSGPAQVASSRYRAGWDRVFARPRRRQKTPPT
jgi:hypothetical protein